MNKELILTIIVSIILVILIIILILIRNIEKRKKEIYKNLIEKYESYFQNLNLVDNQYLPIIEDFSTNVDFKLSSKGDYDKYINYSIKKRYRFVRDKMIYFFNNSMKNKAKIKEIDGKKYYLINTNIYHLDILANFEAGTHILAKYNIINENGILKMVIDDSQEDYNEKK